MASDDGKTPEWEAARALPLRTRQYRALAEALSQELPSMAAVARRLGVSRSYMSRLMSGERKVVGEAAIANACAALGLPREYFDDPAFEHEHYRQAIRHGAPPIDALTMMQLAASGEALASHAELVLEAIGEGAPLSRPLRHLVSSARATLYLERHEEVVDLVERGAGEAELRAVAHAYALAMRQLGKVLEAAARSAVWASDNRPQP